jgi:hypothetical protein
MREVGGTHNGIKEYMMNLSMGQLNLTHIECFKC